MFSNTFKKFSKIDKKTLLKEGVDTVLEVGTESAKTAISGVIYGTLIKLGIGLVIIVGAVTATIYGIGALFSGAS